MEIEQQHWANYPVNSIVYSFRERIKHVTQIEDAVVGKIEKNVVLTITHPWRTGSHPFRLKQDGTAYKKDTCTWVNSFYDNLKEAEDARGQAIEQLRKKLNDKIQLLQDKVSKL